MKQIVALVNKWDKKHLEKFNADIYFAHSLNNFSEYLHKNSLPVSSLGIASRNFKIFSKVIISHPELRFYFLDKRTKNWNLEPSDWKIRNFENVEGSPLDFQEVILLANDPPVVPKRILETNLLVHEAASKFE